MIAVVLPLLAFLAVPVGARAVESLDAEHVRVSWVAPKELGAGSSHVGIRFVLDPGWHVYWKNPGDSGAAPKFRLSAEGASLGEVEWPVPSRIPFGDLVNLGYSNEVVFPFEVRPSGADRVHLSARLEWLVCEEECIPGFGTLGLERPVSAERAVWPEGAEASLGTFVAQVPASAESSPWKVREATRAPEGLRVSLDREGEPSSAIELYPVDGELVLPAKPVVRKTSSGIEALFQFAPGREALGSGVLVVIEGERAWELASVPLVTSSPPGTEGRAAYGVLVLSAFLGGLLLNLMPCVFPVLSIKVFSVLDAVKTPGGVRRDGLLYTAGVLASFAALGAAFLALRGAGASIGWGFQLQSPAVVLLLAALFWLLAMNFLGVFELGFGVMNWAGRYSKSSSAFATGTLSVFVAAPCTGPFMGSALAASTTLPAAQAMTIFLGLGAGLAAPYLALTMSPSLCARLPRPGAWMETVKQLLAFPLLATVLWLLWVLGQQVGDAGWLIGGSLLLTLSFVLWLARTPRPAVRFASWALALVAVAYSVHSVRAVPPPEASLVESASRWAPYDPQQIATARAEGHPVFLDFTAAWCVTCQWNKKTVLDTPDASRLFERHGVTLVRADWTSQDARITGALAEHGRNSVPLYVFHPGDGSSPRILPQILTFGMLEDLFAANPEEKLK